MAKPGKRRKRADHGAGCGFCPAQIDLYGKTWQDRKKELKDASWSTVLVQTTGMDRPESYNGCPKCSDRLGPGPIDHDRRYARP